MGTGSPAAAGTPPEPGTSQLFLSRAWLCLAWVPQQPAGPSASAPEHTCQVFTLRNEVSKAFRPSAIHLTTVTWPLGRQITSFMHSALGGPVCTVDVLPGKPGFSFHTLGSPHLPRVCTSMQPRWASGFPHAQENPQAPPLPGSWETPPSGCPLFASLHGGQTFPLRFNPFLFTLNRNDCCPHYGLKRIMTF